MQSGQMTSARARIQHLERRLHFFEGGFSLALVCLLAVTFLGMRARTEQRADIMRVRGLIVEDAQGRARILLGAPVPQLPDRKRQDAASGMIVLGENGADRVSVGAPTPSPQIQGKVAKRIADGAGMQIHDQEGNERGGFSFLDNGRVVLGLDYPTREAVSMFVMPEGYAGLIISGQEGRSWERAGLVVNNTTNSVVLKLADGNNEERAMLMVRGDSAARLLMLDPATKQQWDVLEKLKR
jgi:hypothetical protein